MRVGVTHPGNRRGGSGPDNVVGGEMHRGPTGDDGGRSTRSDDIDGREMSRTPTSRESSSLGVGMLVECDRDAEHGRHYKVNDAKRPCRRHNPPPVLTCTDPKEP